MNFGTDIFSSAAGESKVWVWVYSLWQLDCNWLKENNWYSDPLDFGGKQVKAIFGNYDTRDTFSIFRFDETLVLGAI